MERQIGGAVGSGNEDEDTSSTVLHFVDGRTIKVVGTPVRELLRLLFQNHARLFNPKYFLVNQTQGDPYGPYKSKRLNCRKIENDPCKFPPVLFMDEKMDEALTKFMGRCVIEPLTFSFAIFKESTVRNALAWREVKLPKSG